jgi:hypothetical protein
MCGNIPSRPSATQARKGIPKGLQKRRHRDSRRKLPIKGSPKRRIGSLFRRIPADQGMPHNSKKAQGNAIEQ